MGRRKKKRTKLMRSIADKLRLDIVYVNNPVLVGGLALAPVVAAATTLQNAIMLAVTVFLLHVPVRFMGNLLVGFVPQRLRAMVYALMASGIYIPLFMLMTRVFGNDVTRLGIYFPMMVVDSIVIWRAEVPQRERPARCFTNGVKTAVGFALVVTIIGAVRELLGEGRIWSFTVIPRPPVPFAGTAAGGFVVVALFAAILQQMISSTKRKLYRDSGGYKGE